MKRRGWVDFLFIFPCALAFLMVIIIPFVLGIYYSMTDWNGVNSILNWVGIDNFKVMFSQPQFLYSFLITLFYTAINIVLVNLAGFLMSLLATSRVKGRNFYRAGFFIPNLIGGDLLGLKTQSRTERGFHELVVPPRECDLPELDGLMGGFLGGISGVMMGTEQLNMIIHNTIYVPGHFHATVVVGTTLTFMALTYYLIPVLFKREMIAPKLAQWQPYLFGFSMYFFTLVMMGAGTLGVSRRHWDMAFSGNALAYEWPGAAYLMMGLVGIGGVAAIAGGAIYIYVTVGSLLWGKKLDAGVTSPKFTPVARAAPTAAAQTYGSAGFVAPGTFVLAMFFLVTFVLYYFVNWKYLGQLWGLS